MNQDLMISHILYSPETYDGTFYYILCKTSHQMCYRYTIISRYLLLYLIYGIAICSQVEGMVAILQSFFSFTQRLLFQIDKTFLGLLLRALNVKTLKIDFYYYSLQMGNLVILSLLLIELINLEVNNPYEFHAYIFQ